LVADGTVRSDTTDSGNDGIPGFRAVGYQQVKHPEQHQAPQDDRPDSDEEIPQYVPEIAFIPLVVYITQRSRLRVRFEEFYFSNFMPENDTKQGMSQLVDGCAQPGDNIRPAGPEGFSQGVEREVGYEMYQQTEDKDSDKHGNNLAEGQGEKLFKKLCGGHVDCIITTPSEAVKNQRYPAIYEILNIKINRGTMM